MKKPILTVGIPTFNRASRLRGLLDSIANQYTGDVKERVEILISDNCSTDETWSVLGEYSEKHGFQIRRNEKNLGMDQNLCEICKVARGEFMWWMGDDDIVLPDFLAWIIGLLEEQPHDFIFVPAGDGPPGCTTYLMGIFQPVEGKVWDLVCKHGLFRFFGSIGHCLFRLSKLINYESLTEHAFCFTHAFGLLLSLKDSNALIITKGGFDVPRKSETEIADYCERWGKDKLWTEGWLSCARVLNELIKAGSIPQPTPEFFKMIVRQHWPLHFHLYQSLCTKAFELNEFINDEELNLLKELTKYLKSPEYDVLSDRVIALLIEHNANKRHRHELSREMEKSKAIAFDVYKTRWA